MYNKKAKTTGFSFGFLFGSDMAQVKDMPRNKLSLDPPAPAVSGDSRYLTRLWVSGKGELPEERSRSESSQSAIPSGMSFFLILSIYI